MASQRRSESPPQGELEELEPCELEEPAPPLPERRSPVGRIMSSRSGANLLHEHFQHELDSIVSGEDGSEKISESNASEEEEISWVEWLLAAPEEHTIQGHHNGNITAAQFRAPLAGSDDGHGLTESLTSSRRWTAVVKEEDLREEGQQALALARKLFAETLQTWHEAKQAISQGLLTRNGKRVGDGTQLQAGDVLSLRCPRYVWVKDKGLGVILEHFERGDDLGPNAPLHKADFSCNGVPDICFVELIVGGSDANYVVPLDANTEEKIRQNHIFEKQLYRKEVNKRRRSKPKFVDVEIAVDYLAYGRRAAEGGERFGLLVIGVVLFFLMWGMLASVDTTAPIERGIRTRLGSIVFEVTPGPYGSQQIRAATYDSVTSIGDLYDWLTAAVETLSEDDQAIYDTPAERAQQVSDALARLNDPEFAHMWRAVGVQPPPSSAAAVSLSVDHNCTRAYNEMRLVSPQSAKAEACERHSGCCLWKEIWMEACISCLSAQSANSTGQRPRFLAAALLSPELAPGRAVSYDTFGSGPGGTIINRNRLLPWLVLRTQRRKQTLHQCGSMGDADVDLSVGAGCRGDEDEKESWKGISTGAVFDYASPELSFDSDSDEGAFQHYIRLEPELVSANIGLLELLRKDRWIDQNTHKVFLSGLSWNPDLSHLTHFEVRWSIGLGGMFKQPYITINSANLSLGKFSTRSFVQNLIIVVCFLQQIALILHKVNRLVASVRAHEDDEAWNFMHMAVLTIYIGFHVLYMWTQFSVLAGDDLDIGEPLLRDQQLLQVVQGGRGAVMTAAVQSKALAIWLRDFNSFRNLHGILCLISSIELFGHFQFSKQMSMLINAWIRAKYTLGSFFISALLAAYVWTYAAHFTFARRDYKFRGFWSSLASFVGPTAGGNSNVEEEAMEQGRSVTTDAALATALYFTYVIFVIFLTFNILIAILVDGFEESKAEYEKRQEYYRNKKHAIKACAKTMSRIFVHSIALPKSSKGTIYVPVPQGMYALSCSHPIEYLDKKPHRATDFRVDVLPAGQGKESKGRFIAVRHESGWEEPYKLHILASRDHFRKMYLEDPDVRKLAQIAPGNSKCCRPCDKCSRGCGSICGNTHTRFTKRWYRLKSACSRRHLTPQEHWAQNGVSYLHDVCTVFARDQISERILNQNTLSEQEQSTLAQALIERRSRSVVQLLKDGLLNAKKELALAEAQLQHASDTTIKSKTLRRLEDDLEWYADSLRLAETKLTHLEFVELLVGAGAPLELAHTLWSTFATAVDEDNEIAQKGGPATWRQVEDLKTDLEAKIQSPILANDKLLNAIASLADKVDAITARLDTLENAQSTQLRAN